MKLLKIAIETHNWDLAAHVVVYAAAKKLIEIETSGETKKTHPRRTVEEPKRP